MKILWLCNIMLPKIAKHLNLNITSYGGWLTGLSNSLLEESDVSLAVCFPNNNLGIEKGKIDNLEYYAFHIKGKNFLKYNKDLKNYFIKVIQEYIPDVIHIFGTEYPHTLSMIEACSELNILNIAIINIQGLVSVCSNHYFEGLPFNAINKFTFRDLIKRDNIFLQKKKFEKNGLFEIKALKLCKNVSGRTDLDCACTSEINPKAKYHFCNETLRDSFYEGDKWAYETCEKHSIFISQAGYPIKGLHYILEALPQIITKYPNTKVYIAGNNLINKKFYKITSYAMYMKKLIKKYNLQKYIVFLGNLNENQMKQQYLKANVFVSASTIENSPNSLGESMICGTPTISSFVGGVSSMMSHEKEGLLYPCNEPCMLACYVEKIFSDEGIAAMLSKNAIVRAENTHDIANNKETIMAIYKEIAK